MSGRLSSHWRLLGAAWRADALGRDDRRGFSGLRLHAGSRCARGNHRKANEDRSYSDLNSGIFLVADGMGGHRGGAQASQAIIEAMPVVFENAVRTGIDGPCGFQKVFDEAIRAARLRMVRTAWQQQKYRGMGSTLAAAVIVGETAYISHSGDCRVYHISGSGICRVTRDETYAQDLVDAGVITVEQARSHSTRHVVTNHVGIRAPKQRATVKAIRLVPGDRIVLATDGVTRSLDDESVRTIVRGAGSVQGAADELVLEALNRGSRDNTTCIVISVLRAAVSTPPAEQEHAA